MTTTRPRRTLVQLVGDVPALVRELVTGEIELLKTELLTKLKIAGIGAGLVAGAGVVALLFAGALTTSGILALSLVMPGWLAALIVAGVLLVITAILALLGVQQLKRTMPPYPTTTIDSLTRDVAVLRGVARKGDLE